MCVLGSGRQWWDHGKTENKLLCQQYTLNVTRDTCRSVRELEGKIVDFEILSASIENLLCLKKCP